MNLSERGQKQRRLLLGGHTTDDVQAVDESPYKRRTMRDRWRKAEYEPNDVSAAETAPSLPGVPM